MENFNLIIEENLDDQTFWENFKIELRDEFDLFTNEIDHKIKNVTSINEYNKLLMIKSIVRNYFFNNLDLDNFYENKTRNNSQV